MWARVLSLTAAFALSSLPEAGAPMKSSLIVPACPPSARSSELPPAGCAVEAAELAWLASALFNAGVDLSAAGQHAAAAAAMRAALAAAAVGLQGLLTSADASGQVRCSGVLGVRLPCIAA